MLSRMIRTFSRDWNRDWESLSDIFHRTKRYWYEPMWILLRMYLLYVRAPIVLDPDDVLVQVRVQLLPAFSIERLFLNRKKVEESQKRSRLRTNAQRFQKTLEASNIISIRRYRSRALLWRNKPQQPYTLTIGKTQCPTLAALLIQFRAICRSWSLWQLPLAWVL